MSQHSATNESVEDLSVLLNTTCTDILDTIAPVKAEGAKRMFVPWLNEHTRTIRGECRRAEKRWKNSRLYVSLLSLRLSSCQILCPQTARSHRFCVMFLIILLIRIKRWSHANRKDV
ncbi:hypothetical protein ILYODFUR_028533 [Ilyodon furcidens]|uniref:Uncharacterized protein n=1 Tax=Ilyodon furcidens TaxID=33524 RepID=A0ABV0TBT3_9TELE